MRAATSGREDLNLRPVAAATALQLFFQLIPSSPSLVISLALRCTGTGVKAFTVEQQPRYSVFRRFRIASVMATNSLRQILAGTDVAPSGLLAQQHVTVKHSAWSEVDVGARGFEPPTSWSQTTRSTKLSYAPNMQPVVYHGFCPRASGERTRLAFLALCRTFYPKFGASRFSTAGTASLRRVA